MKAIVVGAVESTRIALQAIGAAPGFEAAALVTLPASLAGRHSDFADLREDARRLGAAVIEAGAGNAPDVIERIKSFGAEIGFVIGWSQICSPAMRSALGGEAVGYHPAPLPRMRGRAAIPWTILKAEPITASSLFWLDDGVDSGPILAQKFLHVADDETATTLYRRHLEALDEILSASLPAIAAGDPPRIAQDERYATFTARRTPADGAIDWRRPAADIARLVRATTRPYPGAFTTLKGAPLVVWRAETWPLASRHAAAPGQVIVREASGFAVACGEGALWIDDYSAPGAELRAHMMLGERN